MIKLLDLLVCIIHKKLLDFPMILEITNLS